MSRGGSEKGAEAGRGSSEKRGESIVILNQKYSGIKPKTASKSGSNQMYDVPKMVHKNGYVRGHKKMLQRSNIFIIGSEIFKRCDRLRTISSYGISLESYPRSV